MSRSPSDGGAEQGSHAADRARLFAMSAVARDLGGRYAPERVRLDAFHVYDPKQKPVLERLRALAGRLPEFVATGGGVLFYGLVGTGKDHLLAWLLYQAAGRGLSCRWVNGQEVYGRFRDAMDGGASEDDLLRHLAEPQVLAVSDPIPPVGSPTAWNVSQLYRLLDRRYRALKSTWVSVNALSADDADAKLSAPVFDRLREGAELFPCFWDSYRKVARKGGA